MSLLKPAGSLVFSEKTVVGASLEPELNAGAKVSTLVRAEISGFGAGIVGVGG